KIKEAAEAIGGRLTGCRSVRVGASDVRRHGIRAMRIDVKVDERFDHRTGGELMRALSGCAEDCRLSSRAQGFSRGVLRTILRAEANVHGTTVDRVRLHEVGSADTLADIIGVAVALEDLRLLEGVEIHSTPVTVGGGLFRSSHGTLSSPAPATLEILKEGGIPMIGGPIEAELVTPTGAALLANLIDSVSRFYPSMVAERVGYGAGGKDFEEIPNVLRVLIGSKASARTSVEEVCVLETNLDDVTGEVVGHAISRLMEVGAKDVSVIPTTTKKSRPGYVVKVVADKRDAEGLAWEMMRETGSIGVRAYVCQRFVLRREVIPIDVELRGVRGRIGVKVVRNSDGRIVRLKPEFDDVRALAKRVGRPVREVMEYAHRRAREILSKA
ncbi:TPA: nickel pincer cofactor biosynthesis protein LarC, partial [Candidatus Bathyarchaeota archaeon]|nr:nickel pincer cofactor biosynthesis protein LarC [Candidatus Bathyarchaeota archaeon]